MTVYDGSTPLPTLLSGEIPSGTKYDTILAALHGLSDARTAYTPSWTSTGTAPSLGNGTLTGNYAQCGKFAAYRAVLVIGSTTTLGTGAYRISLPTGAVPLTDQLVQSLLNDVSGSVRFAGLAWIISQASTGDNMRIVFSGESAFSNMTGSSPVALATGDRLIQQGVYEVA